MWWRTAPGSLVAMQLLTRLRFAGDLEPGFAGYHTGHSLPLGRFGPVIANLRTDFRQRRLLEAQRAELAAHNAQLGSALEASVEQLRRQAAELQASRTRIVAAADCERRRIERNLHDGAQQRLTALAIKLSLACELAESHDDQVREVLDELCTDVREAVDELRCLAHGIYPPVLVESGLPAALSAIARRSTLPITVHATPLGRYPAEVEAAVYFCCLEAIQNACKHAGDQARLDVRVSADGAALAFDVSDDGQGFQASHRGLGAGFVNMQDRLCALGGRLRVESAPQQGTRVSGTVPVGCAAHPDVAVPS
jgi:signal transduction histidine kinase